MLLELQAHRGCLLPQGIGGGTPGHSTQVHKMTIQHRGTGAPPPPEAAGAGVRVDPKERT